MSEELTAKEVLEIIGEICSGHPYCENCPFKEMFGDHCSHIELGSYPREIIEICRQRKLDHAPIKTEWVHICRIIEDLGYKKRCVYEKEIDKDEILPFGLYDSTAEEILKEYYKNHDGNFFATVERLCRRVVR